MRLSSVRTEVQAAEAAKEVAEQRFWLPLERSKGRQMGELCVSLLFTKVNPLTPQLKFVLCMLTHSLQTLVQQACSWWQHS